MFRVLRAFSLLSVLAASLALAGCGGNQGTVQPPKPEPTTTASGPVDEPPSADEK